MDMDESNTWLVVAADWIDRGLSLWHLHRLLSVFIAFVFGLGLVLFRSRYARRSRPGVASPGSEEKASWLQEKQQDIASQAKAGLAAPDGKLSRTAKPTKTPASKVVAGRRPASRTGVDLKPNSRSTSLQPFVFYSSLTGTTERLANGLGDSLRKLSHDCSSILQPQLHDLSYVDLDDYFISGPKTAGNAQNFYLILIPSYDIDTILNTFLLHLDETHHDFRIDTAPLSRLAGYSVFGIGDRNGWPTEEQGFCSQAIEVDKWMSKLTGRKRAYPLGLGDIHNELDKSLQEWVSGLGAALQDICHSGSLGEGIPGSGDPVESDEEAEEDFPDLGRRKRQKLSKSTDVEDVGGGKSKSKAPLAVDFTDTPVPTSNSIGIKAMVPKESPTHAALTKQGYTIVGTHSGVKICRWTKSALRGRGSCYKNSFYGIASHLCMETTPSLSCSNKCVFCWRHGTNPVSTTWRWQVDDPTMIFEGAKEGHYKKIKMMRGVPGVRSERFEEAMRIKHCALSLVGEPIFYPRINEFVDLLHGERISSFLVCNAQHPQQLKDLKRVTQLYVSIDASNRDSLRKIDRPLHRDFWERFQSCLDILKEKRFLQRTVYRLTLVKGFNVEDEVEGYADLIQRGLPCFVEVKGVTYCGTSSAAGAGLTMQNVPFYAEVVTFVEALNTALAKRGLEYGLAAEHEHSCCVLLASKRFFINDKWHTIIDYDKFFELLEDGQTFTPEDYCKETPEWALWGNGGFDPRDQRVDRKGRPKDLPVKKRDLNM